MKLKGFDKEFETLEDYILKITYHIWEKRGIDKIRDWYGKVAPVYTPLGITKDVEKVIQGTLETLNAFPDRVLLGQDVMGREVEESTYYSSHRIFSTMTHLGNDAFWGAATKRKVKTMVIADCICRNNQIIEEWLVRDQSAIALAIGRDVEELGREQGQKLKEKKLLLPPATYVNIWQGSVVKEKDKPVELEALVLFVVNAMKRIFNDNDINSLYKTHHRSAYAYFPGYRHCHGNAEMIDYLVSFLSSFTKRDFRVHHAINQKEANAYPRVALRWTLLARHEGNGLYGSPTNKEITIMGMSHFEIKNNLIYRAYHLFDELSIWAQIESN